MIVDGAERSVSPLTISTTSCSSTDEMVESENQSMRDRVVDLEKKVIEQNDEIMCLRSTLADALRRINSLEGITASRSGVRLSTIKDSTSRLRHDASVDVRDGSRRASPTISGRGFGVTPNALSRGRRTPHYQSASSLYSDGHSSSSASPAPSPSPTGGISTSVKGCNGSARHHLRYSPSAQPSKTPVHESCSLNKKWASTSDFGSPKRQLTGNGHQERESTPNRRPMSGSFQNLSSLRGPSPHVMRHGKEILFNAEEGQVKMYIRGRPLTFHIPTELLESYHPMKTPVSHGAKLKLEWVYGYRGRDCRQNLHQLPTGEIVYFIASVVVLYNTEEQSQRHYLGHTDDIKCIAIHPNKLTIATGQTAGHDRKDARSWRLNPPIDPFSSDAEEWPHIRIWDSVNLSTLHVIGIGDIEKSVACLAFSKADGGGLLVAVDEAPDHNMSVWDWSRNEHGFKLLETKCAADPVLMVEFSPVDRNMIITCGRNQIAFWLYESGMLAKKVGIFDSRERPKYVTAISFTDSGNVISGDSNGNLLVWQRGGSRVEYAVKSAHEGAILSILVQKDGTVITGGKDRKIIEWQSNLVKTGNVIELPLYFGAPRVVTSGRGAQLIIGTTRNCILGGTFALPLQPLIQGHTDELWALCPHPSQNQFLTAGLDSMCYLWDTMAKTIVWSKDIGASIQSAAFSRNAEVIVLGLTCGSFVILDTDTREVIGRQKDISESIQVLQFSPNGKYLAMGSQDKNIHIYKVSEGARKYMRSGRCQGHTSAVLHVDWSKDSQYLRSNSPDYEIYHWDVSSCKQIVDASSLRDVEWATHFCPLTFGSLGVWNDNTDTTTIAKANGYNYLVTGDDLGKLKVFNYPAAHVKLQPSETGGHSSYVTSVRFLHNDARLVSLGGRDSAVMQWMTQWSVSPPHSNLL